MELLVDVVTGCCDLAFLSSPIPTLSGGLLWPIIESKRRKGRPVSVRQRSVRTTSLDGGAKIGHGKNGNPWA